jgi:hypothetical protein
MCGMVRLSNTPSNKCTWIIRKELLCNLSKGVIAALCVDEHLPAWCLSVSADRW